MSELINPLIVNGSPIMRSPFSGSSIFYDDYRYLTASAERRDISYAIGCARSAQRPSLKERLASLEKAAQTFTYSNQHLEHTVRMTGMPIRVVEDFYKQIPDLLRSVPRGAASRFGRTGGPFPHDLEILDEGLYKVLLPQEGFCYAITPGNDPRAAALIAANLAYLGLPFVLRASPRDAVPPLLIEALVQGGFDPTFASLVYLNPSEPDSTFKNFKLVDASSAVWTFGAAERIDPTLRFEKRGQRVNLNLDEFTEEMDLPSVKHVLKNLGTEELLKRIRLEDEMVDHFKEKLILRHSAGNCAGIAWGDLSETTGQILYQSFACPAVCSAMKSVRVVDGGEWIQQAADLFKDLVVGDPLDPTTQVGYIAPRTLDSLEAMTTANACLISTVGGRRISAQQAEPLLVCAENEAPQFFAQEIPAYVLAARSCEDTDEAIEVINNSTSTPRLAVTLLNAPSSQKLPVLLKLNTHAVLVNQPTSQFTPLLHEGNDYLLELSKARLLMF
jgi:acyl-CoA reductase-like NAD-dependent aldehyde dehydrogenase